MTTTHQPVGRRTFLQGAAVGAAGIVAHTREAEALPEAQQGGAAPVPAPERVEVFHTDRPGADFMVDVIKSLGFEYVAANPGSSFRGIHESLINYGGNAAPELLTCLHEESSVAMAHGYAKIEGKPMLVMAHGTVGLQHASMAVYNAYCDRVPIYILLGNILDVALAPQRRRVDPRRAGLRRDGARLHQVGRHAGVARALRRVVRARLQDRDDAAARPGRARRRCHAAGRADAGRRPHAPPRADAVARVAADWRQRRRWRTGEDAGGRRESRDHHRACGADAEGPRAAGRTGGAAAGAGARPEARCPADELPVAAPASRRRRRRGRSRAGPRGGGLLPSGARADSGKQAGHGVAADHQGRARRPRRSRRTSS